MARDFLSANENTRRTDTIGFVMMWTGFAAFLISIFNFPTLHIPCLALVPVGFLVILAGKVVHGAKTMLRPFYDENERMKRQPVPFVKMALRPRNWLYSVIGIVVSLTFISIAALVG